MADIFVSYSSKDRDIAVTFCAALSALGYTVWRDNLLTPFEAWDEVLERELNTARCVLVLWSPNAVQSQWVRNEASRALRQNKLVPLRVAQCEPPLGFEHVQIADLVGWQGDDAHVGWSRALGWIESFTGRAPSAAAGAKTHTAGDLSALIKIWEEVRADASREELAVFLRDVAGTPLAMAVSIRMKQLGGSVVGRDWRDHPHLSVLITLPTGAFLMGSDDAGSADNEGPPTRVTIGSAFAIGRDPVTVKEWRAYLADTGRSVAASGAFGSLRHPVTNVSWEDASAYCEWASRLSGARYRLPSEAEWEYACRAGSETAYAFGADIGAQHANFAPEGAGAATGKTTPPGFYPPNAFGLHDMHGNVSEWCADTWRPNHVGRVGAEVILNGAPARRAVRGGSWYTLKSDTRSSSRIAVELSQRTNDLGFRIVREIA